MMQKLLLPVCVFLLSLSICFGAVSVQDVSLDRDDEQERSNPLVTGSRSQLDNTRELEYARFIVPIAVSGTATINEVRFDLDNFSYAPFGGTFDENVTTLVDKTFPITLTDQTMTVGIDILVPSNLNAVDNSLEKQQHSVRAIFDTSEGSVDSMLTFFVENGLFLDQVEILTDDDTIDCDVEEDDVRLDCDDEIEEFVPGQDFRVRLDLENIFDDDSELDFDTVDFDFDSDNNDVEIDDESFDEEDLETEENIVLTVEFEVDEDIEDDDDVEISFEAETIDENGARHGFKHTFDIEFDIPDYSLRINQFDVTPSSVCQGEAAEAVFEIENRGTKTQRDIIVTVESDDLRVKETFTDIELEELEDRENDYGDRVRLPTSSNQRIGPYSVFLRVDFEGEDGSEQLTRNDVFTVQRCDDIGQPFDSGNTPVQVDSEFVVIQPAGQNTPSGVQAPLVPLSGNVEQTEQQTDSATIWFLLAIVVVLLFIIAAVWILIN